MTTDPSDTLRVKHLEFLQNVIGRMGNRSFLVKGWLVTMTTALLAVSVERGSWPVAASAMVPLVPFWCVDGFFLRQERMYRELYDVVRRAEDVLEPLCMNASPYRARVAWRRAAGSVTLVAFYGTVVIVDLAVVAMTARLA